MHGYAHARNPTPHWMEPISAPTMARSTPCPPKHLDRHVQEFVARHNMRDLPTLDRTAEMFTGMEGQRLRYLDLVA